MSFGDVVKYENKEYVYLDVLGEIMFLLTIPNQELSKLWKKTIDRAFMNGGRAAKQKQSWWQMCFIQLSTEQFKDRIVLYAEPGTNYNPEYFMDVIGTLNKQDKIELQKKIIDEPAVATQLRESIKQLDLTNLKD